jgi:hypothetical protein
MKLGAARSEARAAWRLIDIEVAPNAATFSFALNRQTHLLQFAPGWVT